VSRKPSPCGKAWKPTGAVRFAATQSILLPIGRGRSWESVAEDSPEHAGAPFDNWKKNDLLVVVTRNRVSYQPGHTGAAFYESWHVATRSNTPAAPHAEARISETGRSLRLARDTHAAYRINWAFLGAAEKLRYQEFDTRDALEEAICLALGT